MRGRAWLENTARRSCCVFSRLFQGSVACSLQLRPLPQPRLKYQYNSLRFITPMHSLYLPCSRTSLPRVLQSGLFTIIRGGAQPPVTGVGLQHVNDVGDERDCTRTPFKTASLRHGKCISAHSRTLLPNRKSNKKSAGSKRKRQEFSFPLTDDCV